MVNGYEDVDRNMFFKLKESRTSGHKAALVKEQCWFGHEKVFVLTEGDKLMEQTAK